MTNSLNIIPAKYSWNTVYKIQIAVISLIFDIQKCANNILCFKLDFAPYGTIKSDILVKKKLNVNSKSLRG